MSVERAAERSEVARKWEGVEWKRSDAEKVGQFIRGEEVKGGGNWFKLKKVTNFEAEDLGELVGMAEKFIAKNELVGKVLGKEEMTKEELGDVEWTMKTRSKTILNMVDRGLKKNGCYDRLDELWRVATYGGVRDEKKKNFSSSIDREVETHGYLPEKEGGVHMRLAIFGLKDSETIKKDLSDQRVRGSLAHEALHATRMLLNKALWTGREELARKIRIRFTKKVKVLRLEVVPKEQMKLGSYFRY